MMKNPQFLKYAIPLINTLKNNGGIGKTADVIDLVIENLGINDKELEDLIPSGQSKIRNHIQWSRFYLVKGGYMDSPKGGTWRLTQLGFDSELNVEDISQLYKKVQHKYNPAFTNKKQKNTNDNNDIGNKVVEDEKQGSELINILKTLSPDGFERICKRLLTEIGINDITITGGSGDQGIDGIGIIRLNDVVNFNIVFQCKRYKETVSPHYVRDFRGAMQGRAEKGLIVSTGRFTSEAKKEANRDGVPPIELIDGERLVGLFEKYQLGLKPRTVYEIEHEFFKNFK